MKIQKSFSRSYIFTTDSAPGDMSVDYIEDKEDTIVEDLEQRAIYLGAQKKFGEGHRFLWPEDGNTALIEIFGNPEESINDKKYEKRINIQAMPDMPKGLTDLLRKRKFKEI